MFVSLCHGVLLLKAVFIVQVASLAAPSSNHTTVADIAKAAGVNVSYVTAVILELKKEDEQGLVANSTNMTPDQANSTNMTPDQAAGAALNGSALSSEEKKHRGNRVSRFISGGGDAVVNAVKGLTNLFAHPIQSVKGAAKSIWRGIRHPRQSWRNFTSRIRKDWKEDSARTAGSITANVGMLVAPSIGATSKVLTRGSKAVQVGDINVIAQGAAESAGQTGLLAKLRNAAGIVNVKGKLPSAAGAAVHGGESASLLSRVRGAAGGIKEKLSSVGSKVQGVITRKKNQGGNVPTKEPHAGQAAVAVEPPTNPFVGATVHVDDAGNTIIRPATQEVATSGHSTTSQISRADSATPEIGTSGTSAVKATTAAAEAASIAPIEMSNNLKNALASARVQTSVPESLTIESLSKPVLPGQAAEKFGQVEVAALSDFAKINYKPSNRKFYNPMSWFFPRKLSKAQIELYANLEKAATARLSQVQELYNKLPKGELKNEFAKIVARDKAIAHQALDLRRMAQRGMWNVAMARKSQTLINVSKYLAVGTVMNGLAGDEIKKSQAALSQSAQAESASDETPGNIATEKVTLPVAPAA